MQQNEVVDLQKFRDAEAGAASQENSGPNYLPSGTKLLFGQYTVEGYLNCGGFGITYTARDSLNRKIVIKECFPGEMVYRDGNAMTPRSARYKDEISAIVRNFVTEAHSVANLKHDNIIHVHQIFEENRTAYIAMDFIDGPDLLDMMESDKRLTPRQIQKLTLTMLDAIGYVHRLGMLHRDISPDNILIDRSGEPVLIDFGAVRVHIQKTQQTLTRMKFVKDGYSPQEFYVAGAEQGTYSDLYALAASMYHLIRGEAPVDGQTRLEALDKDEPDPYTPLVGKVKGYPQNFLAAVDKALSVQPEDRLQTAQEWIDMITPGIARRAVMSRPATAVMESLTMFEGIATKTAPETFRMDKTLLVAGISAVALLAGTAYLVGQWSGVNAAPEVVVLDLPSPAPILVETELQTPSADTPERAIAGLAPLTAVASASGARDGIAELGPVAISVAPEVELPPTRTNAPAIGRNPGLRLAEVGHIARPTVVASLAAPSDVRSLPATPAPLDPPPPLAGKLDMPAFTPGPSSPHGDSFGEFDPVNPPVYVAALPRAMAETSAEADTTPPPAQRTGKVLAAQVTHSYWNVAMPFETERTGDGDLPGARITAVATDASPFRSGNWIAEGAIITAFNGEPLRPETPLSIHVLDAMPSAVDGVIRASVEYRDAAMGFAGSGELVVPVVREIGLADGTVLETRRDGSTWSTSVRETGTSPSDLRPGDIVIAELETGRWFGGHQDIEAALAELAEAGADTAIFTVLRGGERATARWALARE